MSLGKEPGSYYRYAQYPRREKMPELMKQRITEDQNRARNHDHNKNTYQNTHDTTDMILPPQSEIIRS